MRELVLGQISKIDAEDVEEEEAESEEEHAKMGERAVQSTDGIARRYQRRGDRQRSEGPSAMQGAQMSGVTWREVEKE